MRKGLLVVAVAVAAAMSLWAAVPASAAGEIVISVENEDIKGAPGDIFVVAEQAVPSEFVGWTCEANLQIDNNGSVHRGNNLTVLSAGESYVFEDYETLPGQTTVAEGGVLLGETIRVEIQLGEDGRSSGGFMITFDCEEPPSTTTTIVTTTTESSTSTTSTEPPVSTTVTVPTDVLPQTTVPQTTVPPAQPETPTNAEPSFTG